MAESGGQGGTVRPGVLPARVLAGPGDVAPAPPDAATPDFVTYFDGEVPFWRPGLVDIALGLRWKWLLLGPALLLTVGMPVSLIFGSWRFMANGMIWKLWFVALGWCIYLAVSAAKSAVSVRTDDFCIHCGYTLEGLGDGNGAGTCPECGRKFVRHLCAEYRKDPHFFVTRYKALRAYPAVPAPGFAAGDGPTMADGTG